jgi:hypothetical protein
VTRNNLFSRRQEERVFITARRNSIAGNETGIVDRLANCEDLEAARGNVADRIEVNHLTIGEKEGANSAIWRGRESDDLAGSVRTESSALSSSQRTEVADASI